MPLVRRLHTVEEPEGGPSPPWGPGGLEIDLGPEEEQGMITFLGSIKAGLSEKDAESCVRYACALDQFEECGGPRDATAVGKSLGLPKGTVHDLLNEKRRPWSAIEVRHKLGLAFCDRAIIPLMLPQGTQAGERYSTSSPVKVTFGRKIRCWRPS